MSTTPLLPRLPSREELLHWLNDTPADLLPPLFDLSDRHAPDPASEYLRRKYNAKVYTDGWDVVHLNVQGVDFVLAYSHAPAAIGYNTAFSILYSEYPYPLTPQEVADVLRNYENPHAVADRFNLARAVALKVARG